jgi:alkylation response protein AidB-like acyl-CoA dehydrogenase
LNFASDSVKKRLVGPLLRGEIRSCLAITEAEGGSDVANLTRSAVKTPDGKHYLVNGGAKWITNGIYSDVFVTAVRTGGQGMGGLSLLIVERNQGGLKTRKMECMGVSSSGTSYVDFEDVKVPVENLLGKENKGFQLIMHNFTGERAGIVIQANRFSRVLLEESIKYACKRKTFGKRLIEHPVIRAKIANMAQRIESTHCWLESMVYQTIKYDSDTLTLRGGGTMALLKAQATDTFEFCSREACQIFGGLAYTKGGQAEKVERLYREVLAYSIPGGAVDIMKDISVRQSVKIAQIMGKTLSLSLSDSQEVIVPLTICTNSTD